MVILFEDYAFLLSIEHDKNRKLTPEKCHYFGVIHCNFEQNLQAYCGLSNQNSDYIATVVVVLWT